MKKDIKNKMKFFNKIIYVCFLFFITTFFLETVAGFDFSNSIQKKLAVDLVSNKYTQSDIRILEIEPGDSFKLNAKVGTRTVSGVETIDYRGYKIEITHMTMSEFIGKVEQINGKYDVIVIGRYIDNSLTGPNGLIDYSNIKYNNISIKSDLKNKSWFTDYAHLENDITNKKVKEIREFIQSGQLVYIDRTIGDNSNNNPYGNNINWTKLYYHLTNGQGDFVRDIIYSNLNNFIKNKSINELSIEEILNKYKEQSENKLTKQIIYSTSPEGDTLGKLGDINKRNMTFNITSKNPKNEELTINLYLDINGDGLFKEDEIVKTVNGVNLSKGDYTLQYNIYEDYPQFIGYLDWKIEAIKNNNGYSIPIKSHYDGNITFTRLEGEDKRIINVLQVSPFNRDKLDAITSEGYAGEGGKQGANLNLAQNTKFKDLLRLNEVSDYDIKIDVISYQDFYNGKYLGPGKESLNKSKYDMIIMGFSDVYPEESISKEAVDQLKEYVKAGKSLMLTHDTLTYWKAGDQLEKASELMKGFRDISGQSRYVDNLNKEEMDLNGNKIVHDVNKPTDNAKKENGSTFFNMFKGVDANSTESNKVYRTNKTVVTSYPFEITGNEISVRETHGQYFQLNLEDEDTVPILNLTEQNDTNSGQYKNQISFNNKYDSRNFYYTYSRGNITFSGTGENAREINEYPPSEMKLFINTIVKAERSANHKPIITGLSEDKATEVSFNNDFNFDIVVKDPDRDKVKINSVAVEGQDISSINNLSNEYKESGTSYSLKITKDILSKYINKEITVKIEAEDEKKAISIKEYKIKVVSNAIIVQKTVKKRLVINEKESFIIDLETENDSNPTSITIDNNIINPQIEGIFGIESIKSINENGKLKLEIKNLVAYQKEKGREINIPLSYTTSGNKKNVIIKIIYDSDYIRTELPDITAELTSAKTIEINDNNSKEITLEYTIKPQSFTTDVLTTQSGKIEEVIFVVDLSKEMKVDDTWNTLKNEIVNEISSKDNFKQYKFGVIGYNDSVLISDRNNLNEEQNISIKNIQNVESVDLVSPLYNMNNNNLNDNFRKTFQGNEYFEKYRSDTENRNIDNALILAKNVFNNFGEEGKGKAIVLVNTGDVNYSTKVANEIKAKGYRIISVDLSRNNTNNLSKLHSALGGTIGTVTSDSDFIKFEYSVSQKKFITPKIDMQKVANRLLAEIQSNINYSVTPIFTFDLNDNFEYIQNSNSNIKLNSLSENKLKFELDNLIEYSYSNMQNQNGEYIYTANEQKISFKVKIKEGKIGTFNFAENINILDTSTYKNYFEYNNFKGTINKKPLETPTVIVKEQIKNITHGLYNGINKGQFSIQENNGASPFEIAQGSTATFGASFTFSGSSTNFNLNIDNKFSTVNTSDIKIYKVLKDELGNSSIEEVEDKYQEIYIIENNKFKISITKDPNDTSSSMEILVVYQGKITNSTESGKTLTNDIVFSSTSRSTSIITPKQSTNSPILPDLF